MEQKDGSFAAAQDGLAGFFAENLNFALLMPVEEIAHVSAAQCQGNAHKPNRSLIHLVKDDTIGW